MIITLWTDTTIPVVVPARLTGAAESHRIERYIVLYIH